MVPIIDGHVPVDAVAAHRAWKSDKIGQHEFVHLKMIFVWPAIAPDAKVA
jgi:hypothetical protein